MQNAAGNDERLVYEPWEGSKFRTAHPRLLFVGHSFYDDDSEAPYRTYCDWVVNDFIAGSGNRFLTGLMKMGSGLNAGEVEPERFFDHIAFMNLLQAPLDGPRMSAPKERLRQDAEVLPAIVKALGPTQIVLFGDEVWRAVESSGVLTVEKRGEPYWSGDIAGVPALYSRHPSGGFAFAEWATKLGLFLRANDVSEGELEKWVATVRADVARSALL